MPKTPTVVLKIVRKSITNEWKVSVWENGKYAEGPTCYETTKQDAVCTRLVMAADYERRGWIVEPFA